MQPSSPSFNSAEETWSTTSTESQPVVAVSEQGASANKFKFIQGHLGRVPFVGQYVAPLLSNHYILPLTQKIDPFVEAGVQRATPYVEKVMSRVQKATGAIKTAPGQLRQSVSEASGHAVQSLSAMPGHVYQTTVHTVTSTAQKIRVLPVKAYEASGLALQSIRSMPSHVYQISVHTAVSTGQKIRALPAQAYESATVTAASMVGLVKGVSAKVSQSASDVSGKTLQNIKLAASRTMESTMQALENIKVAPTRIFQWSKEFLAKGLENMRAAPGQLHQSAKIIAARSVENIKALVSKVTGAAASAGESLANAGQPYVHRIVKAMAPRAKSVVNHQHVQSVYQQRLVQGAIEKTSPFVAKVANQPTILQISTQVMAWALPAM